MALDAAVTISSASVDLANGGVIDLPGGGPGITDTQMARVSAVAAASGTPSGTCTARFTLVDTTASSTTKCIMYVDATVSFAATPVRAAFAGASGNYLAKVTFADGSDKHDLLGQSRDGRYRWYVSVPDALPTNVTSLVFSFAYTNVI